MSQEEECFLSQRSSAVKQHSMRSYEDDVSHMAKNIGLILVRSGASDEAYEHDEQRSTRSLGARTPALYLNCDAEDGSCARTKDFSLQ